MSNLDLDTLLQRNSGMVWANMDGDLVMLEADSEYYYGIGGIGPRIWDLLEQPMSIAHLSDVVCSKFRVEEEQCRKDLLVFLGQLLDAGLVQRVES